MVITIQPTTPIILNQTPMKNKIDKLNWQNTFLEMGTKELGIDCSALIKTVSDIIHNEVIPLVLEEFEKEVLLDFPADLPYIPLGNTEYEKGYDKGVDDSWTDADKHLKGLFKKHIKEIKKRLTP